MINSCKKKHTQIWGTNKISIVSSIQDSKISGLYKFILSHEHIHLWILLVNKSSKNAEIVSRSF